MNLCYAGIDKISRPLRGVVHNLPRARSNATAGNVLQVIVPNALGASITYIRRLVG